MGSSNHSFYTYDYYSLINSINELDNAQINLFPNSANSLLNIHCPFIISSVRIFDSSGRNIFDSEKVNDHSLSIDTGLYPSGIFLIDISNEKEGHYFKKFLISNSNH